MEQIKSFLELETYLTSVPTRKKMAVANAVDSHTLEAVMHAVDKGVIEAYLIGDGNNGQQYTYKQQIHVFSTVFSILMI